MDEFSDEFKKSLQWLESCFFDVFQYEGAYFKAKQERIPKGTLGNGAIDFFELGLKNKDQQTVEQMLYSAIVYNVCNLLGGYEYTDRFTGILKNELPLFKDYYLVWRVKPEISKNDEGYYGVYTRFAVMGV